MKGTKSVSVYEMVTDKIIKQLEAGVIPWKKPWSGINSGAINRITRKPYSLLNQLLLIHNGEYATFKQWESLGGHVKKGEKAEQVTFWKILPVKDEDDPKVIRNIPILRRYSVFHVSQVEGVEPLEEERVSADHEPIESAEQVKMYYQEREKIEINECFTDNAFYSPTRDFIQVPCREQYNRIDEFYSTLFHEMVHSTGAAKRLNRPELCKTAAFGSETYSKEELTAEIGSATLMNMLGIDTQESFVNSTAYIQSWLNELKNDASMIISASSRAEKAVQFILNEEKCV